MRRPLLTLALIALAGTALAAPPVVWVDTGAGPQQYGPIVRPSTAPSTQPVVVRVEGTIVRRAGAEPRGDGVRLPAAGAAGVILRGVTLDGYEQNISGYRIGPDAPVLIESVRSLNPYSDLDTPFKGQCLYLEGTGPVTVRGFYGYRAGWQPGRPAEARNGYRHTVYSNFDVPELTIEDSWLDEPACAALQTRGRIARVRRCLITNAAVGLLAIGRAELEDVTIYDGHCRYNPATPATATDPGRPASWVADTAVSAYHPVALRNVWIVGRPGQGEDVPGPLRTFHLGAVVGSAKYTAKAEWRPAAGTDADGDGTTDRGTDLIAATDCRIVGWPGQAFAGDRPTRGTGFIVDGRPVDVRAALDALRADLLAERVTVPEAVARGQAIVRTAARATFSR